VPLFSPSNRVPGFEQLQLSAAARYDHYQRTGSSFDPKIGFLWSPAGGLELRGSYSTSFRAPLLSESTADYSGIYLPAAFFYTDPSKAPPGTILLFLQGSNPDVKPETSRNWTLGADWSPAFADGLKLTANYYSIRYSNRIGLPAPRVTVIGNPAYDSIITFDPDAAAVAAIVAGASDISDFAGPGFTSGHVTPSDVDVILDDRVTNTSFTGTSGLDLGVRYGFAIGDNAFVADASVTHIFRFDQQLTPASPIVHALNRVYQPLRWRARGGLSWNRPGWNGSLFLNYAGAYLDDRAATVRDVRAYATVDGNLSYDFPAAAPGWLHGSRIAVYAENLLDARPPRIARDPGTATGLGYDAVNASARGRFLAVQLRRSW
jgi:iron complex outermembrane receptor protein